MFDFNKNSIKLILKQFDKASYYLEFLTNSNMPKLSKEQNQLQALLLKQPEIIDMSYPSLQEYNKSLSKSMSGIRSKIQEEYGENILGKLDRHIKSSRASYAKMIRNNSKNEGFKGF